MQYTLTTPDAAARPRTGRTRINGRDLAVRWSEAADRELARREAPLVLELELYFSCLVKKAVHVRDRSAPAPLAWVNDRLAVYFRVVTSTPCSMDEAERLGRQPEAEVATPASRRLAPRALSIDFRDGAWIGDYSL